MSCVPSILFDIWFVVVGVVVVVVLSRFVQHTVTNLTFLDKLIREADDEKKMVASVQYLTKYEKPKLDKLTPYKVGKE